MTTQRCAPAGYTQGAVLVSQPLIVRGIAAHLQDRATTESDMLALSALSPRAGTLVLPFTAIETNGEYFTVDTGHRCKGTPIVADPDPEIIIDNINVHVRGYVRKGHRYGLYERWIAGGRNGPIVVEQATYDDGGRLHGVYTRRLGHNGHNVVNMRCTFEHGVLVGHFMHMICCNTVAEATCECTYNANGLKTGAHTIRRGPPLRVIPADHGTRDMLIQDQYLNGKRHGMCTKYDRYGSGFPELEVEYRNGVQHGSATRYTNGTEGHFPVSRLSYVDGVKEGPYERYNHLTGMLMLRGIMHNGQRVGAEELFPSESPPYRSAAVATLPLPLPLLPLAPAPTLPATRSSQR